MELKDILKKFSIDEIIYFEENYDKQYLVIKKLSEKIDNKNNFVKLVILNSIISYQLTSKGETYWENFSKFFSSSNNDIIERFKVFIDNFNPRFKESKVKRIEKVYNWFKNLDLITIYSNNLLKFNKDLADILSQKLFDKTIVFATKMFGYSLRALGIKMIFPFEIFIPIDNRIGKISKDLNFWINLSKEVKIPLLHIDSLIWVTFGLSNQEIENIEPNFLKRKIIELKNFLTNFHGPGGI